MSNNSNQLKRWTVIIVAAVLGLAIKDSKPFFVWLAIFPVFCFWGLDSYYLRQEKLFRRLYDRVRGLDDGEVDFSMDTSDLEEDMKNCFSIGFSNTIIFFYLPILALIVVLLLWGLRGLTEN